MKNISDELDEILIKKVISRHYLPNSVEAKLDRLLYIPLRITIISNITSLLLSQIHETNSTDNAR